MLLLYLVINSPSVSKRGLPEEEEYLGERNPERVRDPRKEQE
jgi:hypothetical protein